MTLDRLLHLTVQISLDVLYTQVTEYYISYIINNKLFQEAFSKGDAADLVK